MATSAGAGENIGLEADPPLPSDERTAVAVFTPDGTLIEANRCAFEAFGLAPEEALGKRYDRMHSVSHHPDVVKQAGEMLAAAAAGYVVRRELPLRLAGGRIAIMDCMASPLLDGQ